MTSGYRQLRRPIRGRRIAGVAAGIAEYFGIDVALVRVLWLLSIFLGGGGILAYIIAWIAIPEEEPAPDRASAGASESNPGDNAPAGGNCGAGSSAPVHHSQGTVFRSDGFSYFGLFLVFAGIWLLLKALLPWRLSLYTWPVFLILLGIILLIPRRAGS